MNYQHDITCIDLILYKLKILWKERWVADILPRSNVSRETLSL